MHYFMCAIYEDKYFLKENMYFYILISIYLKYLVNDDLNINSFLRNTDYVLCSIMSMIDYVFFTMVCLVIISIFFFNKYIFRTLTRINILHGT